MTKAFNIIHTADFDVPINVIPIAHNCSEVIIPESDRSDKLCNKVLKKFEIAGHVSGAPAINNPEDDLNHLHHKHWKQVEN